jgi:hypothetical protein
VKQLKRIAHGPEDCDVEDIDWLDSIPEVVDDDTVEEKMHRKL